MMREPRIRTARKINTHWKKIKKATMHFPNRLLKRPIESMGQAHLLDMELLHATRG